MPKQGELDYLKKLGPDGAKHALEKPFSDENHCWFYLMDIANIMALLPPTPAKLLDMGAGTGWTSVFYAKRGYDVVGQDIAEDMIALANVNKERHQLDNLRFIVSDFEEMDLREEFDCAVFYDSLHHSVDEKLAIRAVYKALKPGGICITAEPGEGHAVSPDTQEVVRVFNVTERDMPPWLIMEAGKQAGFREFRLYPRSVRPVEITPSPAPLTAPPPAQEPSLIKRVVRAIREDVPAAPAAPGAPGAPGAPNDSYQNALRGNSFLVMTK